MELEKNTARIRHICAFLSKGGGTLQEMLDWVNRRLENNGDREIGQRVLETCISKLRKGDFEPEVGEVFVLFPVGSLLVVGCSGGTKPPNLRPL